MTTITTTRHIATNSLRNKIVYFYIGNRQLRVLVREWRVEISAKPIRTPRSFKTRKMYVCTHTIQQLSRCFFINTNCLQYKSVRLCKHIFSNTSTQQLQHITICAVVFGCPDKICCSHKTPSDDKLQTFSRPFARLKATRDSRKIVPFNIILARN